MYSQQQEWDETFKELPMEKPQYDHWLDQYESQLKKSKDIPILDLGCGLGQNTLYLIERGYKVISFDFSNEALKRLKYFIPQATAIEGDMLHGLPFENESMGIVIADLSIHYFTWKDTEKILEEIKRVLSKDGIFICRVNSTKDMNYGAGQGTKIEENYYIVDGRYKRFFNEKDIKKLFKQWKLFYVKENDLYRYKTKKVLWEIATQNIK